jgi:hypothetical protein
MMEYEVYQNDDGSTGIFVLHEGEQYQANENHPRYKKIAHALIDGQPVEDILSLFDVEGHVAERLFGLSERVSVADGQVFFDGVPKDSTLTKQILRLMGEYDEDVAGRDITDFMPVVNFYEKIMTNPNEHSREQLFDWLNERDFTITLEGDFIAYKGITREFYSRNHGVAYVDGIQYKGAIPNNFGTVITMPRDSVQHDPGNGCSTGLHVATESFARGFGEIVVPVIVNPRDVVSVPTHCGAEKMRVCRYVVGNEVVAEPYKSALYTWNRPEPEFDEGDLEEDEGEGCAHCGCECSECDCPYGMRCEECGCGGDEEEEAPDEAPIEAAENEGMVFTGPARRELEEAALDVLAPEHSREPIVTDPPFTTRVNGILRPENRILVDAYKESDFSIEGMARHEGYSPEEVQGWITDDPELYDELWRAHTQHLEAVARAEAEHEASVQANIRSLGLDAPPSTPTPRPYPWAWKPRDVRSNPAPYTIIDDDGETD